MDFFRSSERPQVAIEQLPIWVQNPSAVSLYLLREDLIPLAVSGNKFRKLRYNYQKLLADDLEHMISFGGAHSNHISALAQLGNTCNVKTVGIIRGEELADKKLNPTLQMATKNGMELHFVSRSDYRLKENSPAIRPAATSALTLYTLSSPGKPHPIGLTTGQMPQSRSSVRVAVLTTSTFPTNPRS